MDNSTVASLIVAAISLIKIVEKIFDWGFEKFIKKQQSNVIVQLDAQASAAIVELLRRTEDIQEILYTKDNDGIPLVYFPRSHIHDIVARQRATLDKIDDLHSLVMMKNNV